MPPSALPNASEVGASRGTQYVPQDLTPHLPSPERRGGPRAEVLEDDETFEVIEKPDLESAKLAQAKHRHDADLQKHTWEDTKPDKPGDE